jgi:hypothetical protein
MCKEAGFWLEQKKQEQDKLPRHVNPILLSTDMKKYMEALHK